MAIDPRQYMDMPAEDVPFDPSGFTAPGPVFQPPDLGLVPPELYADPQFQVDLGGIQQDIGNRYAALAQQLGYFDPTSGARLPGSVELEAARNRADLNRQRAQAIQDVTNQEQQRGTLWSGVRGLHQGQAESPILTNLADLEATTGQKLGGLYRDVGNLSDEFRSRLGQPLLEATNRRIAAINAQPAAPPPPQPTTTETGAISDTAGQPIQYATASNFESTPYYHNVDIPPAPGAVDTLGGGRMQEGGIVDGPQRPLIGEAGPEAVVPLSQGLPAAMSRLQSLYGGSIKQAPYSYKPGLQSRMRGPTMRWHGRPPTPQDIPAAVARLQSLYSLTDQGGVPPTPPESDFYTPPAAPLPPTNPQVGTPPSPGPGMSTIAPQPAAAPMQKAAQQDATHQISVKTPHGYTLTHKIVQPGGLNRGLIKAASNLLARHAPVPQSPSRVGRATGRRL